MHNFYKGVCNHSPFILNEISRKNLVGKVKSDSPPRYMRRLNYKTNSDRQYKGIDLDKLLYNDILICQVNVGDYMCTVAYTGVIKKLLEVLKMQPKPNVTLQSVIRAVTLAIDNSDIKVDCTCADFKYRYAYWATKYGYKYGKPETRPAKITNPNDKIGSMCKHLTALLANKKWLVKIATIVNDYIKNNYEKFLKVYKLDPDEFMVNQLSYSLGKSGADKKRSKNLKPINIQNSLNKENDEDEEENEVNDNEEET